MTTVCNALVSGSLLHAPLKRRLLQLGRDTRQKLLVTPHSQKECRAIPRKEVVSR
jgi:hypothetical protein